MADRELDPSDRPAKRQRVSDDDAATTSNPGAACLSQTLSLVSDEAARRDLDDQLAKEIRVGVDQFTSPEASGFVGVLKQRYHDFMVNEIALDGKVWHLDEDAGFLASERKAAEATAAEEEAKAKEEKKAEAEQVQEEAKPAEEPAPGPEEESKANSGEVGTDPDQMFRLLTRVDCGSRCQSPQGHFRRHGRRHHRPRPRRRFQAQAQGPRL